MGLHVALLRGINLGARRLPMRDLESLFTAAGCRSVATYIQSGNVVFEASPALAKRVPALIESAISDRFEFQAPVVTRTGQELRAIVRGNPFLKRGAGIETLHVAFLWERPAAGDVKALDPDRSPPDAFVVRGREIYLHCPNGYGRSKLTNAYFDSKLGTTSTVRNWKTLLALLDLAG